MKRGQRLCQCFRNVFGPRSVVPVGIDGLLTLAAPDACMALVVAAAENEGLNPVPALVLRNPRYQERNQSMATPRALARVLIRRQLLRLVLAYSLNR